VPHTVRARAVLPPRTAARWATPTYGPGAYLHLEQLDLYYEVHGDGPPFVLLHGAMRTIESCFSRLMPALAATYRVVAVELQGHGHTPDIDRPLCYVQLAGDVATLLDPLELSAVDVVGYSLGGGVGLQLAIARPRSVRRLIFFGAAGYRQTGYYSEGVPQDATDIPDLDGTMWHDACRRVTPFPEDWINLVAKTVERDATFLGWTPDQVRSIQAPTLLLVGDADIVRPEHTVAGKLCKCLGRDRWTCRQGDRLRCWLRDVCLLWVLACS
jgi:pimeloyl-ACP methyl ester carboxylesterase